MSLNLSLQNALSGLRVSQAALSVTANNIANANNEVHSRQIVDQSAVILNDIGAGVQIDGVTRKTDLYLSRTVRDKTTEAGRTTIIADYMERLQIFLGEPGNDTSINARIDNFFNALQNLADNPERTSLRTTAASSAESLAREMSFLARGIEDLRFEADQDIDRGVNFINGQIQELNRINIAINNAYALQQSTASLEDKRDAAVKNIAEYMNVNTIFQPSGAVYIFAGTGTTLLDDRPYEVRYTPASSLDSFTNDSILGEITVVPINDQGEVIGVPQTLVGQSSIGTIDTSLRDGKLLGLLQLRDIEFPNILRSLDEMAQTITEEINKVHNLGGGYPPPTSLTGARLVDVSEVREWQGSVRFAVLDPNGSPLQNPYDTTTPPIFERGDMRPLTLDFSFDSGEGAVGRHTTQTIIDEFNAFFGPQRPKIHIGNLNDMRLVSRTENNPAGGNFSFDFQFENIDDEYSDVQITNIASTSGVVTPTPALPTAYRVDPGEYIRSGGSLQFDIAGVAGPAIFTVTVDVQVTDATGNVTTTQVTYDVDRTQIDIRNDRYAATGFAGAVPAANVELDTPIRPSAFATMRMVDADGNPLSATATDGFLEIETLNNAHHIVIDDLLSSDFGRLYEAPPVRGTEHGLSHYFGMNNFFVDNGTVRGSAINMAVREDILDNPNYISTARLVQTNPPTTPDTPPFYTYELGRGNNEVVSQMVSLSLQNVAFADTGLLPLTEQTFSAYAGSFLGAVSTNTSFAIDESENKEFLLQGFSDRLSNIAGVNMDEELANTIIFQNAYTAATRVINVTDELFQELMGTF